jgi:hypothetical protein
MNELMIKGAPQMAKTERVEEEAMLVEHRSDLNSLLEWQADDASSELVESSIREGLFPRREGNIMDTLYTRQYFADDEDDDEMNDVEVDDADIPLETITEAEMEVYEIIDSLHAGTLEHKAEEKKSVIAEETKPPSKRNNLDVTDLTMKEVEPVPDASSNSATTQILQALLEGQQKLLSGNSALQQGQRELQQNLSTLQRGQDELQRGQDNLKQMFSAMQQGQDKLQQHVSEIARRATEASAQELFGGLVLSHWS